MKIGTSVANQHQVPFISLAPFLLITFGLAWGILAMFIRKIGSETPSF
jgi:uncharacterized protein